MELPCQILPNFPCREEQNACVNHSVFHENGHQNRDYKRLSSTIIYNNTPNIIPIKITDSLYIGPLQQLNSVNPTYVLNLTSTHIDNQNNQSNDENNQNNQSNTKYKIFEYPMKSDDFHQFIKYIPECVKFIENYKNLDDGKIAYICCRNGYSRSLVVLAAYKLMVQGEQIGNVIHELKNTGLYVSPHYISFLYLLNRLIHQ